MIDYNVRIGTLIIYNNNNNNQYGMIDYNVRIGTLTTESQSLVPCRAAKLSTAAVVPPGTSCL